MSSPPAVTLSYNDFPSRGYSRLNWLTIAALLSQTFSRLMRRPFPGDPGAIR
jgi:hypothetical protein